MPPHRKAVYVVCNFMKTIHSNTVTYLVRITLTPCLAILNFVVIYKYFNGNYINPDSKFALYMGFPFLLIFFALCLISLLGVLEVNLTG